MSRERAKAARKNHRVFCLRSLRGLRETLFRTFVKTATNKPACRVLQSEPQFVARIVRKKFGSRSAQKEI